jgi:hypothetical protein
MTTKPPTRTTISMAERIKLTDFIRSDYASSGLADGAFADKVKEKLGITVRRNHVAAIRDALEIPNNFARTARQPGDVAGAMLALQQQVADLTERLARVERMVEPLR